MNLTYIIGNGFDLGLGLKTSYKEFLECYLCEHHSKGDPPSVSQLKRMIRRNINSWGDAEREFGRLNYLEFGEGTALVSYAVSAYENFRASLNKYIRWRESLFPKIVNDMTCSMFRQELLHFHTRLIGAKARNEFWGDAGSVHVNFITFNYTETLERMIGTKPNVITIDTDTGKKEVGVYFNNPLHVHGEVCHKDVSSPVDVDIVFGVGDKSQISGLSYDGHEVEFEQIRAFLEKRDKMAAQTEGSVVAEALKVLNASDCIVLFGVSLGETDCFWWSKILNTLRARPAARLVFSPFYGHVPDCDIKAFEDEERRNVMERLFGGNSDGIKSSQDETVSRLCERILIIGPGPHRDFDGKLRFYDPFQLTWFKEHLSLKREEVNQ